MNIKQSAIVLALIASATSMTAFAQEAQPVTRAQVAADLQAYQQSGLQALSSTEEGADTNSAQYKAALARYEQLTGKKDVVTSHLTRDQVKADLAAWKDAGLPVAVVGNRTPDFSSPEYQEKLAVYHKNTAAMVQASDEGMTRQEVKADLKAWNDAGMSALENGDHGVDTNSAEYKAAFARYEQLRGHNS